jgi:parallel beta-helix repeat protein
MGTSASPIPAGVRAHLILALGASAGQFGLIVNNGGNFTVRGATKMPVTTATASITPLSGVVITVTDATGWGVGDVITIAPTQGNGIAATEQRFITAVAGNNVTISAAAAAYHYSTGTIRVADLTSNVLVRSSGTVVQAAGGNSAYIQNLAQYTTSFSLLYGEFAYLGANLASKQGITFDGAGVLGVISSSTIREGYNGIYLNAAGDNTLSGNLVYNNGDSGIFVFAANETTLISNDCYSNDTGISLSVSDRIVMRGNAVHSNGSCASCGKAGIKGTSDSRNATLVSNLVYSNADTGIAMCPGGDSTSACSGTLTDNSSYANGGQGISFSGTGSLLNGNKAYANSGSGLYFNFSATNTAISNNTYLNANAGISDWDGFANVFIEDRLGYDAAGASLPDGAAIAYIASGHRLKFFGARINGGVSAAGFDRSGNSLISYNQDFDTGTVRIWGDYALAGSTLTLDHASHIHSSTATAPKIMFGAGHNASVLTPNDANAVSQVITIQRVAGAWQVVGSSTGLLGTFASPIVNQPFPAGAAQFNLTFTEGGAAKNGDIVDFALIAAYGGVNQRKRLLFGPSAAAFNRGRSKLTVAASGGVMLKGIAGTHTLMDMIPGGTYYTFIDSGAFTANFSSMTNMDPLGIQLSGSAGVSLSNAVFDFMGIADTTNTYVTARALTSVGAFSGSTFGVSRSTNAYSYNVLVTGADAGLNWQFSNPPGGNLWGEAFNSDPNGRVSWGSGNTAPTSPSIAAINLSSVSIAFSAVAADAYIAEASTASNYTGTIFLSSTTAQASALTIGALAQNTTYYARVGALWGATTFYADLGTAVTLAAPPGPVNFTGITGTGFTVNWQANSNPAGTLYQAAVSTDINFGIFTSSLTTAGFNVALGGLSTNATFYARVRAVNWSGTLSGDALGVALTAGGVITISANRLPAVWYNTPAAVFNAQGAVSYHYTITSNPADLPGAGDPVFNGSALSTTVLQGDSYFHIWGRDGGGASLGFAHFGPMQTDTVAPTIAAIAAQNSATDAAPIADGGTTIAAAPRFTWSAAVSASPIVGYAFGVSVDPAILPTTVTTTLTFADQPLTASGLYYAKVRALNLAGNLGPVTAMSFNYSSVPSSGGLTLKKNYFNPLKGECTSLDVRAASAGRLRVELYNLLAEKVSTWADLDVAPGTYSYSWCGRNTDNRLVSVGAYFLHVETPDQKTDFKVIVGK